MQEIDSPQLLNQLEKPIYDPTVREVFDIYVDSGCYQEYVNLLGRMSVDSRNLLINANTSQVHKEKSGIPLMGAHNYGWDKDGAARIGAAIEALWGLSIIVDDIIDNDIVRNDQPALWVKYGRSEGSMFPYCAVGDIGENRCPQVITTFKLVSPEEITD